MAVCWLLFYSRSRALRDALPAALAKLKCFPSEPSKMTETSLSLSSFRAPVVNDKLPPSATAPSPPPTVSAPPRLPVPFVLPVFLLPREAAVHVPRVTFLLCRASDAPRLPLILVLLLGQFLRRSAGFGPLRELGNDHVRGASSAVVAPPQRLRATDFAAVFGVPVTPGFPHRLSRSREEVIA